MKKNSKHIIVTGGHHNSGLVVAQALVKQGHRVSWFGHRQAARGDQHDSAEYLEVTSAKLPFYDLKAGKLDSLANILKIPGGFTQARRLLRELKPDAILSFGGYLGLSVAYAGKSLKLPVFLHEQTVIAGKANKLAASFARRIYLTWDSSKRFFPPSRTIVVGLPLRDSILRPKKTTLFKNSRPTLLVMGGKQGSHLLNNLIFANLNSLLSSYNLIHQTGTSSVTGDYQRAVALKDSLPEELSAYYQPEGYIGESEIGHLLTSCDLYIGRSGAHITYELALLGVNSILVPFPHTHSQEQLKNAHFLEHHGLATILIERELSYHNLLSHIRTRLKKNPSPQLLANNATEVIVKDLLESLT